jgi:hypothetical protein
MEMRTVVRGADFHEHSNHDPEESGNLRHRMCVRSTSFRQANGQVSAAAARDRIGRRRLQTVLDGQEIRRPFRATELRRPSAVFTGPVP